MDIAGGRQKTPAVFPVPGASFGARQQGMNEQCEFIFFGSFDGGLVQDSIDVCKTMIFHSSKESGNV
jgi:hypothetical protein